MRRPNGRLSPARTGDETVYVCPTVYAYHFLNIQKYLGIYWPSERKGKLYQPLLTQPNPPVRLVIVSLLERLRNMLDPSRISKAPNPNSLCTVSQLNPARRCFRLHSIEPCLPYWGLTTGIKTGPSTAAQCKANNCLQDVGRWGRRKGMQARFRPMSGRRRKSVGF